MSYLKNIIKKAGTLIGSRRTINLIEGSNVTLTISDNSGTDAVDVTIAAAGGSGSPGGVNTYIQYNDSGSFGGEAAFTYDKTTNKLTVDLIHTDTIQSHGSGGLIIEATGGADCALFGAGGGQNVTFYDGVKLNASTADRILSTDSSKNITALDTTTYPSLTELTYVKGVTSAIQTQLNGKQASGSYEVTTNKDATGGYVGLTLFKINFKNVANTFTSFFTNSNTAARTYTFKDADGTIAFTSDITGTNSGTNTGDETTATIKTKLGAAATGADGYLTSTDWNTFNNKVSYVVPMLNQNNSVVATNQSLTASYNSVIARKYTISSGIKLTINTGAILRIL